MVDLKQEIKLSDLIPSRIPRPKRTAKPKGRPPLPKELVGLRIDSAGLSAAHVVNGEERQLVKVARASLPKGIVSAGEVRDPAALGQALSEFFSTNALPRRGVRIGLGNSRIGVRLIEVPAGGDDQQLENMIRFRAHEMLSASLDEAVIDYHIVGDGVDADGAPTRRIVLVVAYRDSIDRYLTATDAANLDVVGIDLEAFALLRAACAPRTTTDAIALAAISVDHERTTLAISDGEVCHFTRVLDWGDARIDASVGRGLSISAQEASPVWRGLRAPTAESDTEVIPGAEPTPASPAASEADAAGPPAADAKPEPDPAVVRQLVTHELQTLVRDLQSSLRFYQSQPNALPIGIVYASGPLLDVPGIADELRKQLDVELEVIDPFGRFAVAETGERAERPGDLTVALGLGIED